MPPLTLMLGPGPERCTTCSKPMCRCRNCIRPPGMVRHEAKGQCKACYIDARPRTPRRRGSQAGKPRRIDLDHAVVELAIAGHNPHMNLLERTEAIRRLNSFGLSAATIADRLGLTSRTVQRHRSRHRGQQPIALAA